MVEQVEELLAPVWWCLLSMPACSLPLPLRFGLQLWKFLLLFSSPISLPEQVQSKPQGIKEFAQQGEERKVPRCGVRAWANPPSSQRKDSLKGAMGTTC